MSSPFLFVDISKAAEEGAEKGESDKEKDTENEKEKDAAATKIQAAVRGHFTRKSLKPSKTAQKGIEALSESVKEEIQKEFTIDNQGER